MDAPSSIELDQVHITERCEERETNEKTKSVVLKKKKKKWKPFLRTRTSKVNEAPRNSRKFHSRARTQQIASFKDNNMAVTLVVAFAVCFTVVQLVILHVIPSE